MAAQSDFDNRSNVSERFRSHDVGDVPHHTQVCRLNDCFPDVRALMIGSGPRLGRPPSSSD